MTLTLDDLYRSPDHYLHSFDGDAVIFVPMDRAAYRRSIFLDGRISPSLDGSIRLPLEALSAPREPAGATGWIMHVAHCGSTLLARAIDDAAGSLILREPQALRQLAFVPPDARLQLTVAMLAKRYRSDAPTVVKGNVPINFLLPRIAALDRNARMILLYLPLQDYLCAILRSDNHRQWLRRVTTQLEPHLGPMDGWSDVDRAAGLWLAQMRLYASAGATSPHVRTLDAETFFADPQRVLADVADHLHVPLTAATIEETVAGPLFATYSKDPSQTFDNATRLARRREVECQLSQELALADEWADRQQGLILPAMAAIDAAALKPRRHANITIADPQRIR